jgi:triosephosphate isomerase
MNAFMKVVIANLKMNFVTTKECDQYLDALNTAWKNHKHADAVKLVVCPSTLYIERFAKRLPDGILLGAQDSFWETRGSCTSEVSPESLKDASVKAVICGHSERRFNWHETNEQIGHKVSAVITQGMMAIVCVGETREERDHDDMSMVIAEQVTIALVNVSFEQLSQVVIAYEPRWAIGASVTPTTQEIMQVHILIQKILVKKYGVEALEKITIIYGGSVTAALMNDVCIQAHMDGVLVGRESGNPLELIKMIDALV